MTATVTLRVRVALAFAVVANVLGWVLPAANGYPGWQAFRAAFSPVWPFANVKLDPGWFTVLSVASAATNALFYALAAVLVLTPAPTRARARLVLWLAAGATLLDLHWPLSMVRLHGRLQLGYFVWAVSFALLTFAAFLAADLFHRRR